MNAFLKKKVSNELLFFTSARAGVAEDDHVSLIAVGSELVKLFGTEGKIVINAFADLFNAHVTLAMNKVLQGISLDSALNSVEFKSLSDDERENLERAYRKYHPEYKTLVAKYLMANESLDELVRLTQDRAATLGQYGVDKWSAVVNELPSLLAAVFAAWSVHGSKSNYVQCGKNAQVVREPSVIQVRRLPTTLLVFKSFLIF